MERLSAVLRRHSNSRRPTTRASQQRGLALLAVVVLLAALIPAAAGAEDAPSFPNVQIDNLASIVAASEEQVRLTDPQAAEELPHDSLDRPEVLDLLDGVFSVPLEGPIGPFDDLPVTDVLSSHSVVLSESVGGGLASESGDEQPSDEPVLLESTLPVVINGPDGQEAVDLSLEVSADGDLLPEAPLVDLRIPGDIGDGIVLPDVGVSVSLSQGPDGRSPSIIGDSAAVYPNVAEDSDFVVSPAPTGFETFTSLRTPDAPTSQSFDIDLPPGATLKQDGEGAVAESAQGNMILRVHPPSALDAEGAAVPVTLSVEGDTLTLDVDPDTTTAWPVLVDPFFESYAWNASSAGLDSWKPESSSPLLTTPWLGNWNGTLKIGMWVKAAPGQYAWGNGANWWYAVPRLAEEKEKGKLPTSYIVGLSLAGVRFKTTAGASVPYAIAGIYDETKGGWAGLPGGEAVWAYPGNGAALNGASITFTNGEPGKRDKLAQHALGAALWANEAASLGAGRELYVEGATVELGDETVPTVLNPSVASAWVNGAAVEPVTVDAADTGLGLKSVKFSLPGELPATITNACAGTATSPCPSEWSPSLSAAQYDPGKLPGGFNNVTIRATDLLGNETPVGSVAKAQLKVDHTKPALALSGSLTEQATLGTNLEKYTLKYAATDGDEAAPAALSSFGGSGTAPGKTELPAGIAVEANGNVLVLDRANKRVSRFDKDGTYIDQFGTPGTGDGQINDPLSIAVSPSGTIWITEPYNGRVQAFSPSGQFIRKITCACFSQPYGVATGPNQAVWISDIGNNKLFKYNESGTQLAVAHGRAADPAGAATDLSNVVGLAVDASGGVWVPSFFQHKLIKFDVNGNYVTQFGTYGSGDGQVNLPAFVAIAPSGNLMVVDYGNNRLQEFKPDGTFMRKFGSFGSGSGQMNSPQKAAFGPNGVLYVPDYNNHRVNRWEHADLDQQSGVVKAEIKVDGQSVKTDTQSCAKTCPLNGDWTLDADDFAVGQHSVEVITTDGVSLSTPKTLTIETHGDLKDPAIALSGSMTEQASLGTTRPSYTINVNATDPGEANERKSGVASIKVKVDGNEVKSTSPGCPAGGCVLSTQWTLNNLSYSVGSHNVEVIATDAAGRSSSKSLTIDIARDTTAPTITAGAAFYNAPEGWVEQKNYNPNATGKDPAGFGVTSIILKIDGQIVRSQSQECPLGSCNLGLGISPALNMAAYDGGAHPAELRVVDGAGNVAKKTWTINVAPLGAIPAEEASNTLEAMEATVPAEWDFQPVAATEEVLEEQVIEAGDNPHFVEEEGVIKSTGVTTETEIDPATGEIEIEGTLGPIGLEPEIAASEPEISEQSAAVLPASTTSIDTVVRPEYNGAQMFTNIRDASAPTEYGWHIKLQAGQYLEQIDPQHVAVNFSEGDRSWLITAEPAHDAIGHNVQTSLMVDGSDVILTVHHREIGAVYPVVAGQSYETGYSTVIVVLPSPTLSPEEEEDGVEGLETSDLGPFTADEQEDALAYVSGAKPRRDKDKPIHIQQARRLARHVIHGKVPPPSYKRVGGPNGGNNEIEEPEKLIMRSCSAIGLGIDGCGVWNVDFDDNDSNESTYQKSYKWNGHQWVDSWVSTTTPMYCSSHIAWWWSLNISIDLGECGVHKPWVAKVGSGQRLTYFSKYDIKILYVAELPGDIAEKSMTLVNQVYPNGYQRAVAKVRQSNLVQN